MTFRADELRSRLADEARALGFDAFGVAAAVPLDAEAARLDEWLARGRHGTMDYLARLRALRADVRHLLDGARSVICVAHGYGHETGRRRETAAQAGPDRPDASGSRGSVAAAGGDAPPRIARYARGRDYHRVLRRKLTTLATRVAELVPGARTRVAVDTAPILEKAWAERAGLGWRGKHTNLVSRSLGSWTFLGEILTDVELPGDAAHLDFCGSCTRCLDACPTGAFPEPYVMDARRCISYLTIEHRGELGPADAERIGEHLFGCDICLEVCPWNAFAAPTREPDFAERAHVTSRPLSEWIDASDEDLDARIAGSAMRRAGVDGLRRNARAVAHNRARRT